MVQLISLQTRGLYSILYILKNIFTNKKHLQKIVMDDTTEQLLTNDGCEITTAVITHVIAHSLRSNSISVNECIIHTVKSFFYLLLLCYFPVLVSYVYIAINILLIQMLCTHALGSARTVQSPSRNSVKLESSHQSTNRLDVQQICFTVSGTQIFVLTIRQSLVLPRALQF